MAEIKSINVYVKIEKMKISQKILFLFGVGYLNNAIKSKRASAKDFITKKYKRYPFETFKIFKKHVKVKKSQNVYPFMEEI